jgi:hypothetical protein
MSVLFLFRQKVESVDYIFGGVSKHSGNESGLVIVVLNFRFGSLWIPDPVVEVVQKVIIGRDILVQGAD